MLTCVYAVPAVQAKALMGLWRETKMDCISLSPHSLMLHCWLFLCFNDRVPAELRDEHNNVGFINISLAGCKTRGEKMERSAAWPQPATLTLSLITVAPSKEERQMRTICSERQPGHPANTQHRPEGPVRSLPCCKFNVLTSWGSLIATTVKLVRNRTSAGVGKRAWEQAAGCLPSLLLSSRSCIGNLLCHNHLLVNLVWWISDWRKNWLSRRIKEWVADSIPKESFWTWFGSQDGMGGFSQKCTENQMWYSK